MASQQALRPLRERKQELDSASKYFHQYKFTLIR